MNIFLSIFQVVLAIHTAIGAIWKFSNPASAQVIPALTKIPQSVWLGLSVVELVCTVLLIIPLFNKQLSKLASIGFIVIAVEMLAFSGMLLASGDVNHGPMIYWLVVAFICAAMMFARKSIK